MEQVPALQIDGATLVESLSILSYLEETRPQRPLLPPDVVKRAKVLASQRVASIFFNLNFLVGARDLRGDSVGHPAPAESRGFDPRGGGEEERVGAALDQPGVQGGGEAVVGQRRQILRRRRDHPGRLLSHPAGVQRPEVPRGPAAFPHHLADRPRAGEPPGLQGGPPQQPTRLSPRSCQVTCPDCSIKYKLFQLAFAFPPGRIMHSLTFVENSRFDIFSNAF
jgi:hypothetical protein